MNVALRRPMTQEEFFDWAEAQDGRHEFDGLRPVGTVSGTNNHGTIVRNLTAQLYLRLRGTGCRSMTSEGGGVETVGRTVRYPDAAVTCSPVPGLRRLLPDPVVVFEVLSPTSQHMDLVIKPAEYAAVPSILRYVIVLQEQQEVRGYVRIPGGGWTEMPPLPPGSILQLKELGIELPLADLYEDVDFGP